MRRSKIKEVEREITTLTVNELIELIEFEVTPESLLTFLTSNNLSVVDEEGNRIGCQVGGPSCVDGTSCANGSSHPDGTSRAEGDEEDEGFDWDEGISCESSFVSLFLSCGEWSHFFSSLVNEIRDIEGAIETKGGRYLPMEEDLLTAFRLTGPRDVKVVLVGQDPYPAVLGDGTPRAMGLSFSVRRGDVIPKSLMTVYQELEASVKGFRFPSHGDLSSWASQGVLLLNSALTVEPNLPDSHVTIWRGFTKKVIEFIGKIAPQTIFVLWGAKARAIEKAIPRSCPILTAAHPSPINTRGGFRGCNHFNIINEKLISIGKDPIDWNLPN